MTGETVQRRYPRIELEPADSELHKPTARQGVGYVRTQGYAETSRHIPHKDTRRNVSADESIQVCNIGTSGEEQKRKNEVE